MTHGSVFSGIGGPEVAASMLGWENLFHCEINPFGRKILDYYYPNAESYEDITKTDFTKWRGRVNVLTGGFPCQPFSFAGKRKGADDERYLWPHMHRCIAEIQPDWVVCENVGGILTMVEQGSTVEVAGAPSLFDEDDSVHRYQYRGTFTLERICCDLEADGYEVQPILIPACAVGAPHRRDRVFIVGHRTAADTSDARTESVRQERQDAIHGFESTADTDNEGLERNGGQELQVNQGGQETIEHPTVSSERPAADTDGHRGSEVDEHVESQLADGAVALGTRRERSAADTCDAGLQEARTEQQSAGIGGHALWLGEWVERLQGLEIAGCDRWANFPSVSPVHRRNDGIPFDVDGIAIPFAIGSRDKFAYWRNESLKAYGNAIVPQVMYEIFRAIEKVEGLSLF